MPVAVTKRDYYEVLGVRRDANQDEIKSAFRQLAKKWHPDRNPDNKAGAEERMKAIIEAYQVLYDPQKRQRFDTIRGRIPEGVAQTVPAPANEAKGRAWRPFMPRPASEFWKEAAFTSLKNGKWLYAILFSVPYGMAREVEEQRRREESRLRAIRNPQSPIFNPQ